MYGVRKARPAAHLGPQALVHYLLDLFCTRHDGSHWLHAIHYCANLRHDGRGSRVLPSGRERREIPYTALKSYPGRSTSSQFWNSQSLGVCLRQQHFRRPWSGIRAYCYIWLSILVLQDHSLKWTLAPLHRSSWRYLVYYWLLLVSGLLGKLLEVRCRSIAFSAQWLILTRIGQFTLPLLPQHHVHNTSSPPWNALPEYRRRLLILEETVIGNHRNIASNQYSQYPLNDHDDAARERIHALL